jgi:hypothetical protein
MRRATSIKVWERLRKFFKSARHAFFRAAATGFFQFPSKYSMRRRAKIE